MKLLDTLLLIGGPDSDRPILRELLQDEYNLLEADGVEQGLFLLEQNRDYIAAVIVDRPPPRFKGDSFLQEATQRGLIGDIPMLVVITPTGSGHLEELAFSLGASDVVPRPFTHAAIHRRIQIMVDLFRSRQRLLSALDRQAETIRHANQVMVDALSSIIEYRSTESGGHILRIRRFTEILLLEVARSCPEYGLTGENIRNIASAAALHDIGKISIPDSILNKPGKLTAEETAVMRTHTVNGSRMIEALSGATSEEYLRYAYNICRSHHERWDGSGYPDRLSGEDIPICAQVVGLADAFDALTTQRVYKPAIPVQTAVNMVLNGDCGVFSPKLLACFKHVCQQFMDLAQEYAGGRAPNSDAITLPLPSPVFPDHEMGSLQMSQLKYQAMLHYSEATVIEMDAGRGTFHVVYNPVPNFQPIPNTFPLEKALDSAALNHVHPDDVERAQKEYRFLLTDFFDLGLRKHTFSHRIYSPTLTDYRTHRVTFLRLDTGDPNQRKAILIWTPVTPLPVLSNDSGRDIVRENRALLNLMSSVVCRHNDRWYTIAAGSGNLVDLLGYTSVEIKSQFQDRFLELVLPEDRDSLRLHIQNTLQAGDQVESEYRIRHKDGRLLWILEKGCVVTGEDGQEYFYGALIDNTASHTVQEDLSAALRRNQVIIDQTDHIIFEWDIPSASVQISSKWFDIFGYQPDPAAIDDRNLHTTRIHPDDLPALYETAMAIRSGQDNQQLQLRIANISGQYLWCQLRLTILSGTQDRPERVIGLMTNIDTEKRANLALLEQAQQDSLTGLLNKASAQNAIRTYLESGCDLGCALLRIDLDNFKGVNDRYGHLFGDTVLTRAAQTIRRLFRGGDIIGRVGGDEFMVLMKDVLDETLVQERCSLLLSELGQLFCEDPLSCQVTCSIGVSLSPRYGSSFQELFQHADQALYHAKQSGKHRFTIYKSDLELSMQHFSTTISAPIDSNEQPGLANGSLVRAVFRQLSHSADLERTIQEVLALVGQQTNVSRIYIFENNDENTHCSNTFEWCNEGISPQIDNLQNISYETDIPGWESNYDENGVLFCTDISQMQPEYRAILEPQGVKSMLHCAIRENGVFRGYIGLDECATNRIWTQEQVDILTFLSEVVVAFLLKKRIQDKTRATAANLYSILDSQKNWCYVIDPASYHLRYINKKTQRDIPSLQTGQVCYQAIMNRDTPCENCPMGNAADAQCAKTLIHSHHLDTPVVAEAAKIVWNGSPACLITCREPD